MPHKYGKGGFIKGKPYIMEPETHIEYTPVVVWGIVIRDAKVFHYVRKKNGKPNFKVDVCLRYKEDGFITVWLWGESLNASIASNLKKKDNVLIVGELVKRVRTQDGMDIQSVYLDPFMIIPFKNIGVTDTMTNSPRFQKIIEDQFESLDDFELEAEDNPQSEGDIFG